MSRSAKFFRQILPWAVTAGALGYVFGYAIDWSAIPAATRNANLPLFVAITVFDKLVFFAVWGLLQAAVIRRFVEPVSIRDVLSVKGGSELVRVVNNSLADATFLYGISQLVRGRLAAVVAVAGIPFGAHFFVLLIQATLALPLLPGGVEGNHRFALAVLACWVGVAAIAVGVRLGHLHRALRGIGLGSWIERVHPRDLLPFVGWFVLFAIFDVVIQGMASRAFGVSISWVALMARIPILYLAISIPSLGNFGTREIAWANLFSEYGTQGELYAFALWTNMIFLVMHVLIGALFVNRAFALVREVRTARRGGEKLPDPLFRDAFDP